MSGSAMKNLRIFSSLCGQKAMPYVIIVTTMWGYVPEELGVKREEELKRDVWKDMVADGCKIERFENTRSSAWRIIGGLADKPGIQVQLSREIVDGRLGLTQTIAGIASEDRERDSQDRIVV
jgi:hypothetical protein